MSGPKGRAWMNGRRVVIGPGQDGRGDLLRDAKLGPLGIAPAGESAVALTELWRLDAPLRTSFEGGDPGLSPWQMIPATGGLAWRMVQWHASSPKMHRTDTLDLLIFVEGAIELEYEHGHVRLAAGDSVVIQDALHAWHLVGEGPCTAIAVMLRPAVSAG